MLEHETIETKKEICKKENPQLDPTSSLNDNEEVESQPRSPKNKKAFLLKNFDFHLKASMSPFIFSFYLLSSSWSL
jgi:hypothetical protein